jgi:hypothetical protein
LLIQLDGFSQIRIRIKNRKKNDRKEIRNKQNIKIF